MKYMKYIVPLKNTASMLFMQSTKRDSQNHTEVHDIDKQKEPAAFKKLTIEINPI